MKRFEFLPQFTGCKLEILWCPIFTPMEILLGRVKMEHIPFLDQVCPAFNPNCGVNNISLKAIFLISKSN